MVSSDFTSGPVRNLTSEELGQSGFTDLELLSDSGHNLVYRAMFGGKWVVLKSARVEEGSTTRNLQLLRREYDIMRAIDSIYVVRPWQMADIPGIGTAIVMEYVHGRTLNAFLQERPSFHERRRVTEELLEALASLHAQQIVHGDLKSSNILITNSGNHVRLIDFGFADTDAFLAKNIGTTEAVRPPQLSDGETADVQRDIYALGTILQQLFPHCFSLVRKRCLHNRYPSIREVRKALSRSLLMQWLIPVVCSAIIAVISIIGLYRFGARDVPKDEAWQILREQTEKEYDALYLLYADSLINMAEPELMAAMTIHDHYASQMLLLRDSFITANPHYRDLLTEQELTIYTRDYTRLSELFKDYPVRQE